MHDVKFSFPVLQTGLFIGFWPLFSAAEVALSRYLTGTFTAYRARFYVGFLSCIVDDYFVFFYDSAIIFHGFGSDTPFFLEMEKRSYGQIYI